MYHLDMEGFLQLYYWNMVGFPWPQSIKRGTFHLPDYPSIIRLRPPGFVFIASCRWTQLLLYIMSPTSTSVDASKPSKYYRCQKIVAATGKPCTGTFKYPQHLRRHDKHFHLNVSTTFIHVTPGSQSRRSVFTNPKLITPRRRLSTRQIAPESTSVRARSSRSLQSVVANPHKAACSPTALPHASQPASVSPVQSHTALQWPLPAETASTASSCMSPTFATPQFALPPPLESTHPQGSDDDTLAFDDAAWAYKDHATLARNQHPSTSDPGPRPRTLDQAPKPSDAHIPPKSATPLPTYEAKSSPQTHAQPKALAWLTQAAKAKFDSTYEALLAGWGVTTRHTGTCVLVPEDWRFSNPLDLMASFGLDNVPAVGSSRAWYSCADHGTTLARAKVWFSKPRTGLDLDVFVGCGPYKPMDASHLCHHEHCIVHLIYEPANINHARQECCRRARFLRGERRPVPEHCTIHEPPCMMQVSIDTSTFCLTEMLT